MTFSSYGEPITVAGHAGWTPGAGVPYAAAMGMYVGHFDFNQHRVLHAGQRVIAGVKSDTQATRGHLDSLS